MYLLPVGPIRFCGKKVQPIMKGPEKRRFLLGILYHRLMRNAIYGMLMNGDPSGLRIIQLWTPWVT